ncbi:hypothetical protein PsYK624_118540 [Phanerochaete sordida]|uniref:Uncharacterized protein n=1 Tax=Phanerochaete sordida TaxID=48140 RepID=A0A9P3LI28_9APHY|nr:hypothetical protein PsYK624_118540 [Phanerochaete sordida]
MEASQISSALLDSEAAIRSLLEASADIRRAAIRIVADGLSIGASKTGVWSLQANPWLIIRCNPRILTSGLLAQSYDALGHSPSAARAPVRAFYTLYHAAENDLACAETQRRSKTELAWEDREPRTAYRSADPVQHILQAQKRSTLALQMAKCAPAVFRPQLLRRAEHLRIQVHLFASDDLHWGQSSLKHDCGTSQEASSVAAFCYSTESRHTLQAARCTKNVYPSRADSRMTQGLTCTRASSSTETVILIFAARISVQRTMSKPSMSSSFPDDVRPV